VQTGAWGVCFKIWFFYTLFFLPKRTLFFAFEKARGFADKLLL